MNAPEGVERDHPLARFTTVRTGGSADWFARVGSQERLAELLAWAKEAEIEVGVVGSGSNLLVADDGFRGLVLKLDDALATIERDGEHVLCGGGARLPQASARAARWGLDRARVRREHPGHGRRRGEDERQCLRRRARQGARVGGHRVAQRERSAGSRTSSASSTGAPTSRREIVALASFKLERADPAEVKATLARMREQRKAAQPSGIKTFGSTFKNPDDPRAEGRTAGMLLEEAGCRGLQVGGARFSPKHANFVENMGEATTADVLALMAEGRRRVRERFGIELEAEVQLLGDQPQAEAGR